MLLIVFGLPGVGKTFVGKILQKKFGFYLHDGDKDLPEDMHVVLEKNGTITEEMRDEFFGNILRSLHYLHEQHKDIVVAQTFIKEKYRKWVQEQFPDAKFLLVIAPDEVRENRLKLRKDYPLNISYARQMVVNFDEPHIQYMEIDNATDGEKQVKEQLMKILDKPE